MIYIGKLVIFLIKCYQLIKNKLGAKPSCRFYPSCSQYMIEAITKYGFIKGFFMGVKRILKCHPFNPGGYDPVK